MSRRPRESVTVFARLDPRTARTAHSGPICLQRLFAAPPEQAHTRLEDQEAEPGVFLPSRSDLRISMRFAFSRVLEQCGISVGLRSGAGAQRHE